MQQAVTFGQIVRERRGSQGLTQSELARRAGCAPITVRKIEADALRPSVQLAELLAHALSVPGSEQLAFVQLARHETAVSPLPAPIPTTIEIGQADLSGRAVKGFQFAERIGSGGYGVVYRAVQPSVQRDVAVKIILPRFANHPTFIRRFEAEAHLVARLEHPHIVPLYDYWREPDAAYLIMRLLRGGSLDVLLQQGPLPLDVFQQMAQQVGQALATAHRHGVLHQDIKPANVLLDELQNAYLADFGIAKNLAFTEGSSLTEKGTLISSPAYLSPEQIRDEPVYPASDVYCFGLLLFEMLTGKKAFSGPTPERFLQQHLYQPLPLLGKFVPDLPSALDDVLQQATAKQPQQRYPTMAGLLIDLDAALQPTSLDVTLPLMTETDVSPLSSAQIAALENPYLGLRAFTEADASHFFGRETFVQDLLSLLSDGSDLERFVAVVGPSGSGKSSVVKAGLLPALRRGGLPGSDNWFIVDMTPGSQPWQEVAAALRRVAVQPQDDLLALLQADNRGLLRAAQTILPEDTETDLVLLIDQFEELFTLVTDETVRVHFLDSLVTAVLDPHSRLRIIITMRADFTDRPLQYVDFGELLRQRLCLVLPLTPDELTRVITRPLENMGLTMTPELVATIIRDVGDQPGMLPLLQYALTELFEQRSAPTLTLTDYATTGGVTSALSHRADEIYNSLDVSGQEATRQLFLRLITLGEGVEDTRRRVLLAELVELQTSEVFKTSEVLEEYGRFRLLTFDHDPVTRGPTVEVAHEALLREWPLLRGWLRDSREDVRRQRLLAVAAHQWRANHQDDSYLLRGSRLTSFEAWAETTTMALTSDERIFLQTSVTTRDARHAAEAARQQRELEIAQQLAKEQTQRAEEQTRAAQRLRLFAIGLAILLLVTTGIAWFANTQRLQAQDNFKVSERIRLASQAQNALARGEGGEIAALLAMRSLQLGYSPEADSALQGALQIGFAKQQYRGHEGAIWAIEFTSDGRFIITSGGDGTIRMWNAQTGQEVREFIGHQASVNNVTISPDGKWLGSSSPDNTARIWDMSTGTEVEQIAGLSGGGWSAEFTSDGKQLLTVDAVSAKLWDVATKTLIREFVGHTDDVYFMAVSPDGRYLATVSNDATARLWDMQTGIEIRQFLGHVGWIGGVDFSPDGRYLLTTGADGIARIWDVASGTEIRQLIGHTSEIFDGKFSPDGRYVATGGYDKTVRIWDVATGREIRLLRGHTNTLGEVAFSPDGLLLATSSADGTARLWDIWAETEPMEIGPFGGAHTQSQSMMSLSEDRNYTLVGRTQGDVEIWDNEKDEIVQQFQLIGDEISAGVFSADSRYVLIASSDGIVRLWDRLTGLEARRFIGHDGFVRSVAFSLDETAVLSGGEDSTVRLWDIDSGAEIMQFSGQQGPVRSVAFSPDGQSILTGSTDGTARVWDKETGDLLHQIEIPDTEILAVTYLPDGKQVVVAGNDHLAHLWNLETGQEERPFSGHTDSVTHLAISPDAKLLLTGSADQTVRVWDMATGQELRRFGDQASSIMYADFSKDGQRIYSGVSGFAYVWRTALTDTLAFACNQLGRDFTEEEREFYNLNDGDICLEDSSQTAQAEPTWTPIFTTPQPVDAIQTVVDLEFIPIDPTYIQMDIPMQHIYIKTEDGLVIRPNNLNAETLSQPLFTTADAVPDDFLEPPFDRGPYPAGHPLGVTLGEWISAFGTGTYTQKGVKVDLDLHFENLMSNGVYTLWCSSFMFPSFEAIYERPCGAPDGSENKFIADETGTGDIQVVIDAFPPSTDTVIYEIAVAYHSDGQTHGPTVGDFSKNAHVHLIYDFLPPE